MSARANVLLVDDNPANLLALEATLERLDARLVAVRSGRDALAAARLDEFAVVLLDMQMPGMNGLDTLAELKRLPNAKHTPIIFLTALDPGAALASAYARGAVDYLVKPFDPDILRSKVSVFIELFLRGEAIKDKDLSRRRAEALAAQVSKLNQLTSHLSEALTPQHIADVVVVHARALLEADTCALYEVNADGSAADLIGHAGVALEVLAAVRQITPADEGPAGRALRDGCSVWVESVAEYQRTEPRLFAMHATGRRARAFWCAPLRVETRTIGLLAMGFYADHTFTSADRTFIESVGQQCAQALDRARLYEEQRRANQRLRQLNEELQAAIAFRDEFLSIASHELNTPLTPLKLQIAALRRRVYSPEKAAEKLEIAERQVDRLGTLVRQLLDVSRITAGRLELEVEQMDLRALVEEALTRVEDQATRVGSKVTLAPGEPVVGRWDPMRLDQVVSNVVSNALKYGAGKPVEVTVAQEGGLARLVVRDHGIGIAPNLHGRIFERFERAVSSRNFGGFGLGLWIVRQIVDASGGRISVASTPGDGATFTVELPLAGRAGSQAPAPGPARLPE